MEADTGVSLFSLSPCHPAADLLVPGAKNEEKLHTPQPEHYYWLSNIVLLPPLVLPNSPQLVKYGLH